MSITRQAAVAGMFYPSNVEELHNVVSSFLQAAETDEASTTRPLAIIAPHAGYIYSGPIAASVYARLIRYRNDINRVILLGPSHRVPFTGLAASSADYFSTPLGKIPLDKKSLEQVSRLPQVQVLDEAHALEHSLEVHLPFLQEVLGEFTLVPLVVGESRPEDVAAVLDELWEDSGTLIVVSSDLSHYHDYATAKQLDSATSRNIESLNSQGIHYDDACGRNPVNGLIDFAKSHNLSAQTIDLRNSGDTAGTKDKVVGYGAYVFN